MSLRVIHVGLGGRGAHWLDFIAQRSDVNSVAFVDSSPEMIAKARARPGLAAGRFFLKLEDALTAVQADFVLIATPSFLHAEQSLQSLNAGLAVLVEKPLGLSLPEAATVAKRAREVNRPLVVAENFRFFQAERTLRAFLGNGTPGAVRQVVVVDRRDQASHTQGPWVKSMRNPFLTEIGVHHFDAFRYLFGRQAASVLASSFNPPGSDYDHEGGAHALIEFEGGIKLQYSGTFVASRYEYEMRVEAEHGEIKSNRAKVWWRGRGERKFRELPPLPLPAGEALRYPLAGMATILSQFMEALQGRGVPETSGDDNLWTLAMLEASLLSARENRRVSIDEVFPAALRPSSG